MKGWADACPFLIMMKNKTNTNKGIKVPFLTSLLRSQASSAISTVFDFGGAGILHYVFSVHYAIASPIGNILGAIVSFNLGRRWAFKRQDGKISHQAIKYAMTSLLSAAINTAGIAILTENFDIDPGWSKAIVAFFVGISFNFLMFRYFVYK